MTANNKSPARSVVEGGLPAECAAALVYTTFPTSEAALSAGRTLVENRQAGCINILPGMTAIYSWQGKTEVADEVVLIAKVPPDGVAAVTAALAALHPHDTPAILVVPVSAANRAYVDWLRANTEPV